MKLTGVLAIASVFVFSFTAVADEELSPGYNACMAASGGVTVQMRKCQNDAFIYLDGKLNKIYKQAGIPNCPAPGPPQSGSGILPTNRPLRKTTPKRLLPLVKKSAGINVKIPMSMLPI